MGRFLPSFFGWSVFKTIVCTANYLRYRVILVKDFLDCRRRCRLVFLVSPCLAWFRLLGAFPCRFYHYYPLKHPRF